MSAPSPKLRMLAALAAAPLIVGVAAAQQLRPTFCEVLDQEGAPLAGAEVTLVGGRPHLAASLQDVHVVEVVASARGRALARLRPGLCYVAWAQGPLVEGRRARSRAVGYFAAGGMVELRCGAPAGPRRCRVEGADAWRETSALRYYVMTAIPGTEQEVVVDEDGRFEAPGAPFDHLEVRLADGQPLWSAPVGARVLVPPPQRLRVRALDERGRPLAGAAVSHRVTRRTSWPVDGLRSVGDDRTRLLGVTDDEGRCEVVVPFRGDPLRDTKQNLLLFVSAAGRPAVVGGVWNNAHYVNDHKVPRIEGDELTFECPAVEPLQGVVRGAPRGTVANLSAICKLHLQRNSYLHDARVFTADVRPDGSFAFVDVPDDLNSCRLSFLPPEGSEWRPPVYPPEARRVLPADVATEPAPPEPQAFGEVSLQVLDATGGPARGAVALVSSADRSGILLRDSLLRVPLDERGQATLRMPPGSWVVVVVTRDGFGGEPLEVDAAGGRFEMQLAPLARAQVTLLDERGEPVAGASVRSRGTTIRGTSDPVRSTLQGLRATTRMQWEWLRTDERGRVSIPFVPVDGLRQRVELRWDAGRSEEIELQPDAQITARAR